MKNCSNCGRQNPDELVFCKFCSTALTSIEPGGFFDDEPAVGAPVEPAQPAPKTESKSIPEPQIVEVSESSTSGAIEPVRPTKKRTVKPKQEANIEPKSIGEEPIVKKEPAHDSSSTLSDEPIADNSKLLEVKEIPAAVQSEIALPEPPLTPIEPEAEILVAPKVETVLVSDEVDAAEPSLAKDAPPEVSPAESSLPELTPENQLVEVLDPHQPDPLVPEAARIIDTPQAPVHEMGPTSPTPDQPEHRSEKEPEIPPVTSPFFGVAAEAAKANEKPFEFVEETPRHSKSVKKEPTATRPAEPFFDAPPSPPKTEQPPVTATKPTVEPAKPSPEPKKSEPATPAPKSESLKVQHIPGWTVDVPTAPAKSNSPPSSSKPAASSPTQPVVSQGNNGKPIGIGIGVALVGIIAIGLFLKSKGNAPAPTGSAAPSASAGASAPTTVEAPRPKDGPEPAENQDLNLKTYTWQGFPIYAPKDAKPVEGSGPNGSKSFTWEDPARGIKLELFAQAAANTNAMTDWVKTQLGGKSEGPAEVEVPFGGQSYLAINGETNDQWAVFQVRNMAVAWHLRSRDKDDNLRNPIFKSIEEWSSNAGIGQPD